MLPPLFDEILELPGNRLLEQARQAGSRLIGTTCAAATT